MSRKVIVTKRTNVQKDQPITSGVSPDMIKYVSTVPHLKKTLTKYGVAIILNVLDEGECDDMLSSMWNFFEHITQDWATPMFRDNPKSWKEIYKLYPLHSMLIQYFNIGQAQCSWDARQNPKIIDIFAEFWGVEGEELLVSFDGMSLGLPPETMDRGWFNKLWLHTDQSLQSPDFRCVQSWVTALDVKEGDATLAFLEGSHSHHAELANRFLIKDKANWYKLDSLEEGFYKDKGCELTKIKCPKGSLVLWDSRTIHCGVEPIEGRKMPNLRAVIYLCYMPRRDATEANLKKKKKAFEELRTTSHYPANVKLFGKAPNTYGKGLPTITQIDPPILNEIGLKLAGY